MKTNLITSLKHPLVKHLVKLRESRLYREKRGSVLIQGRKMVGEVGQSGLVRLLIVTDPAQIPSGIHAKQLVVASEAVLVKITGVSSSEGIAAEVERPRESSLKGLRWILALEAISDPGNLGTLLRTALALGWSGAFLLEGCCDPYNDKALRAAMGATFRLPLCHGTVAELQQLARYNEAICLSADLQGVTPKEVNGSSPLILILGSEAHGLSAASRAFTQSITIPMSQEMESLNVATAGAILMYVLRVT